MTICPICKQPIVAPHKHAATEARRLLKKKPKPLPGRKIPGPVFRGGQNFRRGQ